MKKTFLQFVVLVLGFLLFPDFVSAQIIPLKGLTVRVVYPSTDEDETPRTIQILSSDSGWRLSWSSLGREFVTDLPYPTYKVKARRGTLEFDGFTGKTGLMHPRLWGEGFFRLTHVLPLWVDKDYLFLKDRKEKRPFNVGLLDPSDVLLQAAPDEYFEKIQQFQNLYNHFVLKNGTASKDMNLKGRDVEELEKFARDFFTISYVAKTDAKIVINKQPRNVTGHILGNSYFHLVVLEDFQNPLILALKFYPEHAPRLFKAHFDYFKEKFEFQVTQVNY